MELSQFKRSTIHNLIVSRTTADHASGFSEGLIIPIRLLDLADIIPFERIIATRIGGDNWSNRVETFALPGDDDYSVVAIGSIAKFFSPGDLTCVITTSLLDASARLRIKRQELPIIDVGFNPTSNKDNSEEPNANIELGSKVLRSIHSTTAFAAERRHVGRFTLDSLISGLRVNRTHPDCLQGSAEIPEVVLEAAGLTRHQCVHVANVDLGGVAITYAVPMAPGIVMTTGAMASFAPVGTVVAVMSFAFGDISAKPVLVRTDGDSVAEITRL